MKPLRSIFREWEFEIPILETPTKAAFEVAHYPPLWAVMEDDEWSCCGGIIRQLHERCECGDRA